MATLIAQKTYTLTLNQEELNILYRVLVDSAAIDEELVYNMADIIVDGIDNLESDVHLYQENEDDEEIDIPF